jgi:hypothetical protein
MGDQKRQASTEQEQNWDAQLDRQHLGLQRSSSTEYSSDEASPSSQASAR